MLRGNWSIVAALAGLALSGASPPQANNAENAQATPNKVEPALSDIATSLRKANEPSPLEQPCDKGDDQRSSDLCAQWKAAEAADSAANAAWVFGALGSLIGLLTLAAAAAAAYFARKAAVETEKGANAAIGAVAETRAANEIARQANEWMLRPYVALTEGRDWSEEPFSSESRLYFRVKNFGQTPARNVRLSIGSQTFADDETLTEIPLLYTGNWGFLAPGDMRDEDARTADLSPADFADFASGNVKLCCRVRIDYEWAAGTDFHEVYLMLVEPGCNRWTLAPEARRPKAGA